MKKLVMLLMVLVMVASASACASNPPEVTTAPTDTPATTESTPPENGIAPGTSWNSVEGYDYEGAQDSVWKYFFFDANDSSYNPMGGYEEREDGNLCAWYPWEGSWVGIGFNKDMEGFLEMNDDGESMRAVLGFVAPADGNYVFTAKVQNPWEQVPDLFTVVKEDGTVVLEEDISQYTSVYGYVTPTDVSLKKGELLYIFCASKEGWASIYSNVTIHYEPTDSSVYEVPEVEIPVKKVFKPSANAQYSASAEFNQEGGVWTYASTKDGVNFTPASYYDEPDWTGEGTPSAAQWFSENGTGIGYNYEAGKDYLEANVTEAFANEGEAAALGFVAPADGKYTIGGYTLDMWGQDCAGVKVVYNGEVIATVDLLGEPTEFTVTVDMKAGETVYIYGESNSGWVSAYLAVWAGETVELTGQWYEEGSEPA